MEQKMYEKNISAIRSRWPKILDKLEEPGRSTSISCEVKEIDGMSVPFVYRDGRTYQLASLCSDEMILDRWKKFVNPNLYDSVIYFFGLGTGMYVRKVLEKEADTKQYKTSVLVYEPDSVILRELIKYYDYSDIFADERMTLVIGGDGFGEIKQWTRQHVGFNNIRGCGSAYHLNYPRFFSAEKKEYETAVGEFLAEYTSSKRFRKIRSETIYSHILTNIKALLWSYSLDSLADSISKDVPVFIVSSGPSLSKNIRELKRAKGKSLIISADSSLGVFDSAGIIPDIYVSIDPVKQKENFLFDWVKDVPVMLEMGSPDFVFNDSKIFFMLCSYDEYSAFVINKLKEKFSVNVSLTGGGSVAHLAFSLAIALGTKRIIFVGQDLAYTDDMAHAAEVAIDDDSMNDSVETVDIYGKPVRSSRELVSYKKWFEGIIEKNDKIDYIDATEGGALIKGTRIMPLGDAIDKYCVNDWNAKEFFSGAERLFTEEQRSSFIEAVKKVPELMNEIISDSRKLITDYEKLEKGIRGGYATGSKLKKLLSECRIFSDKIEENEAFTYIDMLNTESETNVEKNVNNVDPDTARDVLNMCILGREHAESIIKTAEKVRKDFGNLKLE